MAFYALERLIHLYDGYLQSFSVAGYSLLLIQSEGQRYLIINQCPHQQAPLNRATLEGNKLRCPLHGMQFDLVTGSTPDGCTAQLQFLPLKYEGSTIGVEL
jgi:nitrite reductase/ring-hydroxylating ferredoxin subunit